ncbi:MAG TPA: response regulator transcription factor [Gaiellales bacterium]|jgi:DNA-binding NarL/FixJ family response regulator|nr:response regulator transcription factor [Gaiellales bacterium]
MPRIQPPKATAERPMTVMLVDDHASFRASARWLLETEGYIVVAEAASGERALESVGDVQPELVLLDIGLPGIDGFQAALAIRARCPRARIVLTSSRDLADLGADRVSACGAAGFVHKAALTRAAIAAATA